MAKKNTKKKLNDQHKALIVMMIAGYHSNQEILERLKSLYGVSVASASISWYRNNKREQVSDVRATGDPTEQIEEAQKVIRVKGTSDAIRELQESKYLIIKLLMKVKPVTAKTHLMIHDLRIKTDKAIADLRKGIKGEMEPDKIALTDPSGKNMALANRLEIIDAEAEALALRWMTPVGEEKEVQENPKMKTVKKETA